MHSILHSISHTVSHSTWKNTQAGAAVRRGAQTLAALALLGGMGLSARADNPKVTMIVAKRGTLVMELYPEAAPKTVAHILALVNKKFYDGTKIHRVAPDFVVQWGDPESRKAAPSEFDSKHIGAHGSGQNVPLEAKLLHEKYTLGLARSQDPDSGDSQMYINLKANHSLDGGYCVFGKVVKGMELADKLQIGDVITSMRADKETGKSKSDKTEKSR